MFSLLRCAAVSIRQRQIDGFSSFGGGSMPHQFQMAREALGDHAEIVFEPKADREPGGVRREAEHKETHALRKIGRGVGDRPTFSDLFEHGTDLARLHRLVNGNVGDQGPEQRLRFARRLGIGGIGPEYGGGVTDLDAVSTVALQEAVERRGVGKGGGFRDRGVVALLMAIGSEGVEVEGDE